MTLYALILWASSVGASVLLVHLYGHHDEELPPPERPLDLTGRERR